MCPRLTRQQHPEVELAHPKIGDVTVNSLIWGPSSKKMTTTHPLLLRRYSPRDARPNRSTSDLSRPCQLGAAIRGFRPRQCLLRAHGFSADCVKVGGGRLALPRPSHPHMRARVVCLRKMKLDIKLVDFLLIHNFIVGLYLLS